MSMTNKKDFLAEKSFIVLMFGGLDGTRTNGAYFISILSRYL